MVFPRSFHAGLNEGFNVSEAWNAGSERWVPIGRKATVCSCGKVESPLIIDFDKIFGKNSLYILNLSIYSNECLLFATLQFSFDYFVIGPVPIEVQPAAGGSGAATSAKSGTSNGAPPLVVNVTVQLEKGSNRPRTSSSKFLFLFLFLRVILLLITCLNNLSIYIAVSRSRSSAPVEIKNTEKRRRAYFVRQDDERRKWGRYHPY